MVGPMHGTLFLFVLCLPLHFFFSELFRQQPVFVTMRHIHVSLMTWSRVPFLLELSRFTFATINVCYPLKKKKSLLTSSAVCCVFAVCT